MNRQMMIVGALVAAFLGAPSMASAADPAAMSDEAREAAGARYYDKAVRLTRSRRYDKALEWFEKALPYQRDSVDLFYNLVMLSEANKAWDKAWFYGSGYIHLESSGQDTKEIKRVMIQAQRALKRQKRAPVEIAFDIEPFGTTVVVDGVKLTRSGRGTVKLVPGTYAIRAALPDFHPWEESVTVVAGTPATIKGALTAMIYTGFLKIGTTPGAGVDVYIDDKMVGTTPIKPMKLETRRFLVRFEKEGFDRWLRYVTIAKDETYLLEPTLEVTPTP